MEEFDLAEYFGIRSSDYQNDKEERKVISI